MRPGVILGCPRSGTTLLRRLVDAHPALSCPPETGLLTACGRFLHRDRFEGGLEVGVLSALAAQGVPAEQVHERLWTLASGLLDDLARSRGKVRWVEKTATDVFHLEALAPWLQGRVRWVGMLRHGLDVVLSLSDLAQRTGGHLAELRPYAARHSRPWMAWAEAWADASTAILDLAEQQPDDVLLVRYEELVAAPGSVLDRVLRHLGAEGSVDVSAALERPRAPGAGDWKTWERAGVWSDGVGRWRAMPGASRVDLAAVVDPVLIRAGYPAVGADVPGIDGERRQRLAHLAALLRRD